MLWPEPATNAATQNIKGGKLVQQWKFDAEIRVVRSTLDGLRNRKSNMRSRSVFNIQCLFQCDICSIYKGLKQRVTHTITLVSPVTQATQQDMWSSDEVG